MLDFSRYLVIIFVWCAFYTSVSAQDFPYTIEKETREFFFHSGKTKYDGYVDVSDIVYTCFKEYRILNDSGARALSSFSLPEPFDPLYRDIISEIRNSGFYFDGYKILSIKISVLRKNKSRFIDVSDPTISKKQVFSEKQLSFGSAFVSTYNIPDVRVGDLVRIDYSISVPRVKNIEELGSFRIFIHDFVPKSNVQLRIKKDVAALAIYNYRNSAEPHTSISTDVVIDKWSFKSLPALLSEPQSRPGSDAPFIEVVTTSNNIYGLTSPRFNRLSSNLEAFEIGSTYKDYRLTRNFIDSLTPSADIDKSTLARMALNITASYAYDDDRAYFEGEKLFEPSFGTDLIEGKIREANKYETYGALLDGIGAQFVILTPIDKRVGEITDQYVRPYYTGEQLFGLSVPPSGISLFVPKSATCSFYVDEIPFYFENSKTLLYDFSPVEINSKEKVLTFDTRHQGWHIKRPIIVSTNSSQNDNTRKCMINAVPDLENGVIKIQGRLNLSGQYSTLQRSTYLCDEPLPYINPQYHQKLWDRPNIGKVDFNTHSTSDQFPFTTSFNFTYELKLQFDRTSGTYSIEVGDLINHINYALTSSRNRHLPYYPDFLQTDNFSFMIQFPLGVELIELPKNITIDGSLGTYQFNTEFKDNRLRVFSQLLIDQERIEPEKFSDVAKIYKAINKVESSQITFKRVN